MARVTANAAGPGLATGMTRNGARIVHMNTHIDRLGIAARIRGLVGGQDHGLAERTARRLNVTEISLRISIDDLDPHPTLEVIAAVVHEYGVDPTWLMTGSYDPASHRRAMEDERDFVRSAFARLLTRGTSTSDEGLKLEA